MVRPLLFVTHLLIFLLSSACSNLAPLIPKTEQANTFISVETGNVSVEHIKDTTTSAIFSSPTSPQQLSFEETRSVSKDGRETKSPAVRIALAPISSKIVLKFSQKTFYTVHTHKGTKKYSLPAGIYTITSKGTAILLSSSQKKFILKTPQVVTFLEGKPWYFQNNSYSGKAIITLNPNGLTLINRLPVEEYLRGVVPLEIGKRSFKELEALKAQAVAARTYTYSRIRAQKDKRYDLLSTVADQVYGGVGKAQPTTDSAISSTAGVILVDSSQKLVEAFYHSTCGGKTASVDKVWNSSKIPYLQSISDKNSKGDPWCKASPKTDWRVSWSVQELSSIIAKYSVQLKEQPFKGTIRSIEITQRSKSGRVMTCKVTSNYGTFYYGKDKIRQILRRPEKGAPILWSSLFSIKKHGNTIVATGHGFGHGIGMCQFGALGRAKAGQSYKEILRAYYHGVHFQKVVVK